MDKISKTLKRCCLLWIAIHGNVLTVLVATSLLSLSLSLYIYIFLSLLVYILTAKSDPLVLTSVIAELCYISEWVKFCFTSTETVGLLGTGAQDSHLDFHTAPELCYVLYYVLFSYILLFLWTVNSSLFERSGRLSYLSNPLWSLCTCHCVCVCVCLMFDRR